MDAFKALIDQVGSEVDTKIETHIQEAIKKVDVELEKLKANQPTVIIKDGVKIKIEGLKHKQLPRLVQLVNSELNVIMVGMAGTGKTKAAEQAAEVLSLPFYCVSVGSQTSKADLLGYMDANGKYQRSLFREAYENGGVYTMDEIDAGNSNVLIVLNSALSNGLCSFPDKMVKRHENFRFVATANTYGNGADRQYVGRNQLDGATLDRFVILDWEVDEELENNLVEPYGGQSFLKTVRWLRGVAKTSGMRAIVSPRMSIKGATCLHMGVGIDEVVDMVVMAQIPTDKKDSTRRDFINQYRQFHREELEAARKAAKTKKDSKAVAKAKEGVVVSDDFTVEIPF